jgi:hypothetical protein
MVAKMATILVIHVVVIMTVRRPPLKKENAAARCDDEWFKRNKRLEDVHAVCNRLAASTALSAAV